MKPKCLILKSFCNTDYIIIPELLLSFFSLQHFIHIFTLVHTNGKMGGSCQCIDTNWAKQLLVRIYCNIVCLTHFNSGNQSELVCCFFFLNQVIHPVIHDSCQRLVTVASENAIASWKMVSGVFGNTVYTFTGCNEYCAETTSCKYIKRN